MQPPDSYLSQAGLLSVPPSMCTVHLPCCKACSWLLFCFPSRELCASLLASRPLVMFGLSPAKISLHSPAPCSALSGSSRPDGDGFGHGQSSCISCGAQAPEKPVSVQPQGMVLGPVQAPLSLGRRGIGGTPMSQPRQGPAAGWEESCPDKGCKPSPGALHQGARSRAACKQKSVPPTQPHGAGCAPTPCALWYGTQESL